MPKKIESTHSYLSSIINEMDTIFHSLGSSIPSPTKTTEDGMLRHQFSEKDRTIEVACYLKFARVLSAIYATQILMRSGFFQECGVLCRTIIDFTDEVSFLARSSQEDQQAVSDFLADFFQEVEVGDRWERNVDKRSTTPRRKIYAALGRQIASVGVSDQHTTQQSGLYLNDFFSNFVHGASSVITEMMLGDSRLETRGTLAPHLLETWTDQLVETVHRSINGLIDLTHVLRAEKEQLMLRTLLKDFSDRKATLYVCD